MFRKRLKQDEDENLKSILEQRKKAIKNYRKLLTQADEKALRQIEAYTTQIKHSQNLNSTIYLIIVSALLVLVFVSFFFIVNDYSTKIQVQFGIGGIISGAIILLLIIYRNPLKNSQKLTADVIKMQIIYLGFIRQINQIDIMYQQTLLAHHELPPEQLEAAISKIQEIIELSLTC